MGAAASIVNTYSPIQTAIESDLISCESAGLIADRHHLTLLDILHGSNVPDLLSHEIDFCHIPTLYMLDQRSLGEFSCEELCALVGVYETYRDELLAQSAQVTSPVSTRRKKYSLSSPQQQQQQQVKRKASGGLLPSLTLPKRKNSRAGTTVGAIAVGNRPNSADANLVGRGGSGGSVTDAVRAFCLLSMQVRLRSAEYRVARFPDWLMRTCLRCTEPEKAAPVHMQLITHRTDVRCGLDRPAAKLLYLLLHGGSGIFSSADDCPNLFGLSFAHFFDLATRASGATTSTSTSASSSTSHSPSQSQSQSPSLQQ